MPFPPSMPSPPPSRLSPSWHAIQCVKLSTVLAPPSMACVRRGVHYGRAVVVWRGRGGRGRSVCLTGQQGQHCRWLLTMSNNKSNKQQYFLHFIQFIVCVTFFLSFVTNPHSALAQAKCAKEREREGRVDCRV